MIHFNAFVKHDYTGSLTSDEYESFLSMSGEVVKEKDKIETWKRKGMGGVGLRNLGSKGEPFDITTVNLVQSFTDAELKMDVYQSMIGEKYQLRMQSNSYGDFFVLDVKLNSPVMPAPVAAAVIPSQFQAETDANSGPNKANYVLQELRWSLIATAQTSTEP
tara:strand:+ start:145 stop:630 length:486 start_codon:yes stop_codon:yes gene_type:complete